MIHYTEAVYQTWAPTLNGKLKMPFFMSNLIYLKSRQLFYTIRNQNRVKAFTLLNQTPNKLAQPVTKYSKTK